MCFHKQADKVNHEAGVGRHSQNKSIMINQINKNKILKLLQFKKISSLLIFSVFEKKVRHRIHYIYF